MPETLTPPEAYNKLVRDVHAPVFFEKLARVYGIKPADEADARELILLAADLRHANAQIQQQKQASVIKTARQDLRATLSDRGYAVLGGDDTQLNDDNIKLAAADAVDKNPELLQAAAVLNDHLSQRGSN